MDSIAIALIGYGMIGRVHSLAYHELPIFYPGRLPRLRLKIHGERGALSFNLADANWLYFYDATQPSRPIGGEQGWKRLKRCKTMTVRRLRLGAQTSAGYAAMRKTSMHSCGRWSRAPGPSRTLSTACAQLVMDAAYDAARTGKWITVPLA